MTKVIAELGDRFYSLSVKGHATGSEAVCAAVSSVVYALAGFLENTIDETDAKWIDRRLESGDAVLAVFCQGREDIPAAFHMAVIGLLQIEQLTPDLVEVSVSLK